MSSRDGERDPGDTTAGADVEEEGLRPSRHELVEEFEGEERVEEVALGEVFLALDPGQVGPGVGLLQPGPEITRARVGLRLEGRHASGGEDGGELVYAEAQAGSTIEVMPPTQPALRGSGPKA